MTQPFLCQLADDQLYAVKGRGALVHGLIAETIAGCLGRQIGLPIPDFVLAEMPASLVRGFGDPTLESAIGEGTAFASLWQEPVETIATPFLKTIPQRLLAKIYAFDHWIMNGDRTLTEHGGNPNLLVRLDSNSLIVIDHNLAFSNTYHHRELAVHACRPAWIKMSRDFVFCEELFAAMDTALAMLNDITGQLPGAWIEASGDFVERISQTVSRAGQRGFWDEME
ncbi:hypothetical protein E2E30_17790 [Sphingomonas sp. AAP5]|nr:HipA family kinase [Sphingomonas sp. AAP5]QBM77413.1 hypothetical protein E2E30_17790 [Sphingomonas sp. AAP5]